MRQLTRYGCALLAMSAFFLSSLFLTAQLAAENVLEAQKAPSDEEAFLLRRIAEFRKDGDFMRVKQDIENFIVIYPNSQFKHYLYGILGDIHLKERKFKQALESYDKVKDSVVIEDTIINKLQCYYELDHIHHLAEEARPFVETPLEKLEPRREELLFLMAEALFKQALDKQDLREKQALAEEAEKHYQSLTQFEYQETKALALAEILSILEKHEEGAEAYHALAKQNEEQYEDFLFQAATLEAKFNPQKAVETFAEIKSLNGERKREASFNWALLLFQLEDYEKVLSESEKLASEIPEELKPTFQFIVGQSHFSLEHYEEAISPLSAYIESQEKPSDQLKNALFIQMTCAHFLNNEPLLSSTFERFQALFPNDPETPKALFMHAMVLKEKGEVALAEEKLKQIKEAYPSFEDRESLLFEYGLLAHQNERWEESYDALKSYLADFPEGNYLEAAWKLLLSASLNRYKEALTKDENLYTTEAFFQDLQAVLKHRDLFSENEWIDYTLLYAKVSYELNQFEKVLRFLQDHIFTADLKEVSKEHLAEAHFIAALCYSNLKPNYSAFCMHLEEALTLDPDLYDSPTHHLELYNAYISLAGFGSAEEEMCGDAAQKERCIAQAADHLYEAVSAEGINIKQENALWLANHYYMQAKTYFEKYGAYRETPSVEVMTAIERASSQYQALLSNKGNLIHFTHDNLYLELECLKWAKLLEYQGHYSDKLTLLKSLIDEHNRHPEFKWEAKQEALFELGLTYLSLNQSDKALETFGFIRRSSARFPTAMKNTAVLQKARLQFQLLDRELRKESNKEVSDILSDLKELQIRKSALDFPIHLEAALEYAEIRVALSDPKERESRYAFFLKRIKEDFSAKEDLITQDYLTEINKDKEKKHAFDSYMMFIRAEELRLEAKKMWSQEKMQEMEECNEKAQALYNQIEKSPYTPRPLFERTLKSIGKINALTVYE